MHTIRQCRDFAYNTSINVDWVVPEEGFTIDNFGVAGDLRRIIGEQIV